MAEQFLNVWLRIHGSLALCSFLVVMIVCGGRLHSWGQFGMVLDWDRGDFLGLFSWDGQLGMEWLNFLVYGSLVKLKINIHSSNYLWGWNWCHSMSCCHGSGGFEKEIYGLLFTWFLWDIMAIQKHYYLNVKRTRSACMHFPYPCALKKEIEDSIEGRRW